MESSSILTIYRNEDQALVRPYELSIPSHVDTLAELCSYVTLRIPPLHELEITESGQVLQGLPITTSTSTIAYAQGSSESVKQNIKSYRFLYSVTGKPLWRVNECLDARAIVVSVGPGYLPRTCPSIQTQLKKAQLGRHDVNNTKQDSNANNAGTVHHNDKINSYNESESYESVINSSDNDNDNDRDVLTRPFHDTPPHTALHNYSHTMRGSECTTEDNVSTNSSNLSSPAQGTSSSASIITASLEMPTRRSSTKTQTQSLLRGHNEFSSNNHNKNNNKEISTELEEQYEEEEEEEEYSEKHKGKYLTSLLPSKPSVETNISPLSDNTDLANARVSINLTTPTLYPPLSEDESRAVSINTNYANNYIYDNINSGNVIDINDNMNVDAAATTNNNTIKSKDVDVDNNAYSHKTYNNKELNKDEEQIRRFLFAGKEKMSNTGLQITPPSKLPLSSSALLSSSSSSSSLKTESELYSQTNKHNKYNNSNNNNNQSIWNSHINKSTTHTQKDKYYPEGQTKTVISPTFSSLDTPNINTWHQKSIFKTHSEEQEQERQQQKKKEYKSEELEEKLLNKMKPEQKFTKQEHSECKEQQEVMEKNEYTSFVQIHGRWYGVPHSPTFILHHGLSKKENTSHHFDHYHHHNNSNNNNNYNRNLNDETDELNLLTRLSLLLMRKWGAFMQLEKKVNVKTFLRQSSNAENNDDDNNNNAVYQNVTRKEEISAHGRKSLFGIEVIKQKCTTILHDYRTCNQLTHLLSKEQETELKEKSNKDDDECQEETAQYEELEEEEEEHKESEHLESIGCNNEDNKESCTPTTLRVVVEGPALSGVSTTAALLTLFLLLEFNVNKLFCNTLLLPLDFNMLFANEPNTSEEAYTKNNKNYYENKQQFEEQCEDCFEEEEKQYRLSERHFTTKTSNKFYFNNVLQKNSHSFFNDTNNERKRSTYPTKNDVIAANAITITGTTLITKMLHSILHLVFDAIAVHRPRLRHDIWTLCEVWQNVFDVYKSTFDNRIKRNNSSSSSTSTSNSSSCNVLFHHKESSLTSHHSTSQNHSNNTNLDYITTEMSCNKVNGEEWATMLNKFPSISFCSYPQAIVLVGRSVLTRWDTFAQSAFPLLVAAMHYINHCLEQEQEQEQEESVRLKNTKKQQQEQLQHQFRWAWKEEERKRFSSASCLTLLLQSGKRKELLDLLVKLLYCTLPLTIASSLQFSNVFYILDNVNEMLPVSQTSLCTCQKGKKLTQNITLNTKAHLSEHWWKQYAKTFLQCIWSEEGIHLLIAWPHHLPFNETLLLPSPGNIIKTVGLFTEWVNEKQQLSNLSNEIDTASSASQQQQQQEEWQQEENWMKISGQILLPRYIYARNIRFSTDLFLGAPGYLSMLVSFLQQAKGRYSNNWQYKLNPWQQRLSETLHSNKSSYCNRYSDEKCQAANSIVLAFLSNKGKMTSNAVRPIAQTAALHIHDKIENNEYAIRANYADLYNALAELQQLLTTSAVLNV